MLKQLLIILSVGFLTAAHASEPKQALEAFHAALTSGDTAAATARLAPGVTIYESGYVERSRDEYAGHHMPADMKFAKASTSRVLKQTEQREGNMAVIWSETETLATIKGKDVTTLGTETAVLQKSGDNWVIAHLHWSSRKPVEVKKP